MSMPLPTAPLLEPAPVPGSAPHPLLLLHRESAASTAELLGHAELPVWLGAAVRALLPLSGRLPSAVAVKERICLAAAVAREMNFLLHSATDADCRVRLGFSPRALIGDLTGEDVPLGSGLNSRALKRTGARVLVTPPGRTDHHARLDAACRLLLAQLWTGDLQHSEAVQAWLAAVEAAATGVPEARMLAALPAGASPSPLASYVRTPGDGHCWYTSVSHAEALEREAIRDAIADALRAQAHRSPTDLSVIQLIDHDRAIVHVTDEISRRRSVDASLQTKRLRDMWFAGEEEMLLYAAAAGGAVRFLVLSSADPTGAHWTEPRFQVWQLAGSTPSREIVLHLCYLSGAEGSGAAHRSGKSPAHYNVLLPQRAPADTSADFALTSADAAATSHAAAPIAARAWLIDPQETVDTQKRRRFALWELCKAAVLENARLWKMSNDDAASSRLARLLQDRDCGHVPAGAVAPPRGAAATAADVSLPL